MELLRDYSRNSQQATVNGKRIEAGDAWRLEIWFGGWDADALSFFVLGTLLIVLNFDPLQ